MSRHNAKVVWQRRVQEIFIDGAFSREHHWSFDGGAIVQASASPEVIPLPYSAAEPVDPEEAFIAAIASCHMLTFLGIAAKRRWVVDHYQDDAVGLLSTDEQQAVSGVTWVSQVTLRPTVTFLGQAPSQTELAKLHHLAHKHCFIANSIKTEIQIALDD